MIDMHTHILPGVDDGAKNMEMAIKMLELEKKENCTTVVLTPHIRYERDSGNEKEEIMRVYEELKKEVKGIKVLLGSEIYFTKNVYKAIDDNLVITINDTKYLLIEFHLLLPEYDFDEVTYNLKIKGFEPIIAHPERYPYFTKDEAKKLHNNHILLQVNSTSLLGFHGARAKKMGKYLIKKGYASFVASDCHDEKRRTPNLSKVEKYIKKYNLNKSEEIFG